MTHPVLGEQPPFRRSEMLIVHNVFRREFPLMPGLVRAVTDGDRDRAQIIRTHIALVTEALHHHHVFEDTNIWPLLRDRLGGSPTALLNQMEVSLMEDQHHDMAELIPHLDTALSAWSEDPSALSRYVLVDVIERLISVLSDHLRTEESLVVPLLEQHITAAEWNGLLRKQQSAGDPDALALALGMMIYEGDPEAVDQVIDNLPADMRVGIKKRAESTFAAHSQQVHGTATPPFSTDL
ncbi:hemerythrin domain-containing protein [Mycobacteroides abscessus]|uniref:hemerythrin domain-containing protein n=1 Tax=Mycobacteroides abscessus TaxID=36809 RepID=UPI000926304E|nr:hemerythrin domain-containing protein [Mycobacteroides abscessus]SHP38906.1 hemerythrin HHE cation binding domain-containing protein [Mycobacteroides abscessus subsp. abscessus]SHS05016.1 hemerythrin HHE cation binding domain-containing protein [Mycobacteroides abscessus subsp. abscessus]SHS26326.1 hemerythrin HHE cation binding domain-containing protein [Mycobacteroides abscessus subsp. abscessus]SHT06729.1 hemerythrin HHE cation binding domain-containing protein [Mycobacteroides abscessus 